MPGNIERRKRQAVLSALVSGCWLVLSAVVVLWLRQLLRPNGILSVVLAVIYYFVNIRRYSEQSGE